MSKSTKFGLKVVKLEPAKLLALLNYYYHAYALKAMAH